MPVPKGYRKPLEILRLTLNSVIEPEDIAAVKLALHLRQTVTVKLGTNQPDENDASFVEDCLVIEARPS
jgi:hypothetical protein